MILFKREKESGLYLHIHHTAKTKGDEDTLPLNLFLSASGHFLDSSRERRSHSGDTTLHDAAGKSLWIAFCYLEILQSTI